MAQICAEIDRTPVQAKKLLKSLGFLGIRTYIGPKARYMLYDASSLEVIKALIEIPHRDVGGHTTDWLSQYISEGEHRGTRPV